jgi:transcriptional regulator with GAF, ATPase, and Fis domain
MVMASPGTKLIVDENEFFHEATMRICGSLDIRIFMRRTLEYLEQVLRISTISMHIYEDELNSIRTIAVSDQNKDEEMDIFSTPSEEARTTLIKQDFPRLEISRRELKPVEIRIVNRPDTDIMMGSMGPLFSSRNFSAILMRLRLQGKLLGLIAFRTEGIDNFTVEDAKLISLLHEPLSIALSNHLSNREVLELKDRLLDENRYLHRELLQLRGDKIVGADLSLKPIMDLVQQVARLKSPVLLQGETGVGKDVLAHAIHYLSPRREGPFVKVNCGAIPETLIDSELFGHEKGAFTGAVVRKRGYFERANNGTIFLDEIGELSPHVQVRLLRVLQYQEFERVGGSGPTRVDIRIVAATHRNLDEMVRNEQFRMDLWFRLNVFPILIPPLRERKTDIPELIHHFITQKSKELRLPTPVLAQGAIGMLTAYSWPGNVRELENVIERALILSQGRPLSFDQLVSSLEMVDSHSPIDKNERFDFDETVASHIRRVLQMTGGKVHGPGGAADKLRMNPSTLRNKMKRLGIAYGRRSQQLGASKMRG